MNYETIIAILAAIILIIIGVIVIYKSEHFGDVLDVRKDNVDYVDITKQFPEIKTFANDSDFRMGLDKCIEYKMMNGNKGNCVEYGITGNAWYYPEVDYQLSNYRTSNKHSNQNKDFDVEETKVDERNRDEPNNARESFPALR